MDESRGGPGVPGRNVPPADFLSRERPYVVRPRPCAHHRVAVSHGPDVAQQLRALLAVGDTRGKQIHDANVATTMLAHGIRILLTDNLDDFARWGHLIDVQKL